MKKIFICTPGRSVDTDKYMVSICLKGYIFNIFSKMKKILMSMKCAKTAMPDS